MQNPHEAVSKRSRGGQWESRVRLRLDMTFLSQASVFLPVSPARSTAPNGLLITTSRAAAELREKLNQTADTVNNLDTLPCKPHPQIRGCSRQTQG
ncbi:hypothetical protein QQF64_009364 [Cirrhinus molitorella]|uniref:Uncharacterized protein n=1 Tax=Cirrhinus molitorella TaxID=172907 RepID=A0ABR3M0Y5_9TELE